MVASPFRVASIRASRGEGADRESIRRLAVLDQRPPPRGPVVLAEIGGQPIAAVGIADGHTVADPARSTPALLSHLRLLRLQNRVIASIRTI
jgi:hypothetical protein